MPPNKHWGELKNQVISIAALISLLTSIRAIGQAGGKCLDTFGRHPPEKAGASGCHGFGGNQVSSDRIDAV